MGRQSRLRAERSHQYQKNKGKKKPYVVAETVELDLTAEESAELNAFQSELNVPGQPPLSVEAVIKKLVFWAMSQIVELGHQRQAAIELQKQQEKSDGREIPRDTASDPATTSTSTDTDSSPLANPPTAPAEG